MSALPLVLRREAFGGILFDPTDGTHLELDEPAVAFVQGWLEDGRLPEGETERAFFAELLEAMPGLAGAPRPYRFLDRRAGGGVPRLSTVLASPTLVDLQITRRCRMGCPHCYASSEPEGEHLPLADIVRVLREVAEAGACQLALGGGEPLLHPEIVAVLEEARRLGLVPNLTSSGDGLDDRVLEALARCCGAVALSLEGVGSDFALRRCVGFRFFEESLARLIGAGVRPALQVTLSRENLGRLPSIVDYCLSQPLYGVIFLAYKPVGRGRGFNTPLSSVSAAELFPSLREAFVRLADHTRVGYDCCLTPGIVGIEAALGLSAEDQLEGCSATRSSVGVTTDLQVVPCTFLTHRPLGDLRRQRFLEIWRGAEAEAFRDRLEARAREDAVCRRCAQRASCLGGCPEWDLVGCNYDTRSGTSSAATSRVD